MDGDWDDGELILESEEDKIADAARRMFCHCGNAIKMSCIWSNGTWKMLYTCSKVLDGQETSGHIKEEVTLSTLTQIQDKSLLYQIITVSPRQTKEKKAFGSLSVAQIKNILLNPILERTINKCPLCQTVGPMVVWQLSLAEMRFACICTNCQLASDICDVLECSN